MNKRRIGFALAAALLVRFCDARRRSLRYSALARRKILFVQALPALVALILLMLA